MALVDPEKAEGGLRIVEEKYLAVYPALKGKYLGALCDSADGVKLWSVLFLLLGMLHGSIR